MNKLIYYKKCSLCEIKITTGSRSGLCRSCSAKGKKLSIEARYKLSQLMRGNNRGVGNKGKKRSDSERKRLSELSKNRIYTLEDRLKRSILMKGERNHRWEGGKTKTHLLIRRSLEYRLWREQVFFRDDFTCQICNKRGIKIHADHIKPFAQFPELRLDINNGRTLCIDCHKKTDTYGKRKQQLSFAPQEASGDHPVKIQI